VRPERPQEEQILLWCGVVAQLQRTRANRILDGQPLPYPLFVLLRHFCHDPEREWTVGQLAAAFETGQPGMTKRVRKLLDLGLLASRDDPDDARRRWLRVTSLGVELRDELVGLLAPDQAKVFEGWEPAEIDALHRGLDRLRRALDDDREPVVPADGDAPRTGAAPTPTLPVLGLVFPVARRPPPDAASEEEPSDPSPD